MAIKASTRRKVLQEAVKLVNEMIQVNEVVYRADAVAKKTSVDETATLNLFLASIGPAVDVTGAGTTLADKLCSILYANATVTIDSVAYTLNGAGWQHAAE